MVGGGGPDRGKCTIEVVVDGVAQVEIRGATGTIHTLSGQPAQWRRFECTAVMPSNPVNFRFTGVDGRGRQDLTRDPRNFGVALVQIEDNNGGREGYTFDINWDGRGASSGPITTNPPNYQERDQRGATIPQWNNDRNGVQGQYRPDYQSSDYYRRYGHGFGVDEAVRVCQQAVLTRAIQRFRTRDIHFERTSIDDNPGRNDRVMGVVDVHSDRGPRQQTYAFACSVDFDNGSVRSVTLDPRPLSSDSRSR